MSAKGGIKKRENEESLRNEKDKIEEESQKKTDELTKERYIKKKKIN